jgi:hypothetical protein
VRDSLNRWRSIGVSNAESRVLVPSTNLEMTSAIYYLSSFSIRDATHTSPSTSISTRPGHELPRLDHLLNVR